MDKIGLTLAQLREMQDRLEAALVDNIFIEDVNIENTVCCSFTAYDHVKTSKFLVDSEGRTFDLI